MGQSCAKQDIINYEVFEHASQREKKALESIIIAAGPNLLIPDGRERRKLIYRVGKEGSFDLKTRRMREAS